MTRYCRYDGSRIPPKSRMTDEEYAEGVRSLRSFLLEPAPRTPNDLEELLDLIDRLDDERLARGACA